MRLIDADALMKSINTIPINALQQILYKRYVDRAIMGAPTINGWVSVKDRFPEKEGKYLVFTSDFASIRTAMFTLSLKRRFDYTIFEDDEPDRPGFYNWDSEDGWIQDDVTHWMPLPEPPKEEEPS